MWPVNEQQSKSDDRATTEQSGEAVEQPSEDVPADSDDRTPEEAGYGYGV